MYLNFRQAETGLLGRQALPQAYVDACRFLHCGVIDRSGSLGAPFAWQVLDAIPVIGTVSCPATLDFGALCDTRGEEIVAEAVRLGRRIQVFWSGGIDSTSALIGVMRAVEWRGCPERVTVLLSMESVLEYPEFYLRFIDGRYRIRAVGQQIAGALDAEALNVTGEHGDQLFGSQLLMPYVRKGVAGSNYRDLLPLAMLERLHDPLAVRRARNLLQPVLDAAPAPIETLFDALWWLNFTLKWQDVSVRMVGLSGPEADRGFDSLRHFFRTEPFQRWALATTPGRPVERWTDYKLPAKAYVRAFTGDERYFRQKLKEDSLRNVLSTRNPTTRFRVFMRDDFLPVVTTEEVPMAGRLRQVLTREILAPTQPFPEFGGVS